MSRKLTNKQEQFVIEYLKDLNATQAAIRAGYSEKSARQIGTDNLSKAYIAEAIQTQMDKRSERVKLTADDVLRDIIEIKDRCMQKEQVMAYDKELREYVETGEWQFDAGNALKASELLGKHLKLFTDKVEHSGDVGLNLKVEWSDEED